MCVSCNSSICLLEAKKGDPVQLGAKKKHASRMTRLLQVALQQYRDEVASRQFPSPQYTPYRIPKQVSLHSMNIVRSGVTAAAWAAGWCCCSQRNQQPPPREQPHAHTLQEPRHAPSFLELCTCMSTSP